MHLHLVNATSLVKLHILKDQSICDSIKGKCPYYIGLKGFGCLSKISHKCDLSRVLHKQGMNTCIVDKTAQCSLRNLQTEVFREPNLSTLYLVDVSTYTQTISMIKKNTQKRKREKNTQKQIHIFLRMYKNSYKQNSLLLAYMVPRNKGSLLTSMIP